MKFSKLDRTFACLVAVDQSGTVLRLRVAFLEMFGNQMFVVTTFRNVQKSPLGKKSETSQFSDF